MTKEDAHEYLPLIQALGDGKTIEYKCTYTGLWSAYDRHCFDEKPSHYRIKPEARIFTIVKSKLTGSIYSASEWDGTLPDEQHPQWEAITVQEIL